MKPSHFFPCVPPKRIRVNVRVPSHSVHILIVSIMLLPIIYLIPARPLPPMPLPAPAYLLPVSKLLKLIATLVLALVLLLRSAAAWARAEKPLEDISPPALAWESRFNHYLFNFCKRGRKSTWLDWILDASSLVIEFGGIAPVGNRAARWRGRGERKLFLDFVLESGIYDGSVERMFVGEGGKKWEMGSWYITFCGYV